LVEKGVECGLADEGFGLGGEKGAGEGLAEGGALGEVEVQADAKIGYMIDLIWLIDGGLLEYHTFDPFACLVYIIAINYHR
jgi:hypothetical protein